jgi:hypothetical protein
LISFLPQDGTKIESWPQSSVEALVRGALSKLTRLKCLALSSNQLTPRALSFIRHLPLLEELLIAGAGLPSSAGAPLASILLPLCMLRYVHLAGNEFDEASQTALERAVPRVEFNFDEEDEAAPQPIFDGNAGGMGDVVELDDADSGDDVDSDSDVVSEDDAGDGDEEGGGGVPHVEHDGVDDTNDMAA